MRKLGQELGVEAMSLYKHVANKEDMLDGMVDVVFSEMDLPPQGAHWKTAMRLSQFPSDQYPYLAETIAEHINKSGWEYGDEFEFGLDLVLDGLERLRDTI